MRAKKEKLTDKEKEALSRAGRLMRSRVGKEHFSPERMRALSNQGWAKRKESKKN